MASRYSIPYTGDEREEPPALLATSHFFDLFITLETISVFYVAGIMAERAKRAAILDSLSALYLYTYDNLNLLTFDAVIGHAFSFFRDADGCLSAGRKYFKDTREPFTITLAGQKIYVITAAEDVQTTNNNTKQLTFDPYMKDMMISFGATTAAIDTMFEIPAKKLPEQSMLEQNPSQKSLAHLAEAMIRTQLHPGKHLDELQEVFLGRIHGLVRGDSLHPHTLLSSTPKSRDVSLLDWTRNSLLEGATTAFFGEALLKIEPRLFDNFFEFDEKSWKLTYKIPAPWCNDMIAAKTMAQDTLTRYFEMPRDKRIGECWLVRALEAELRAQEIQSPDIAAYFMMIYWVINANAWKLCFWVLAYLFYSPDLLSAIRTEIYPIYETSSNPSVLASRLADCPRLMALYYEVLRMATSSVSVRDVQSDIGIGGKFLRAGNRVLIPYRQMLFDEDVFGEDSGAFNPNRFLNDTKLSNSPSFRPFGGGSTYCPGRFLAKAEILTFVTLVVCRFDIELAPNHKSADSNFPEMEIRRPCLGIMGPKKGGDVFLKVREVGHAAVARA